MSTIADRATGDTMIRSPSYSPLSSYHSIHDPTVRSRVPTKGSSVLFWKPWRLFGIGGLLFVALAIWTLWYGMNSDRDDISPLLNQLLPAGHCACKTSTRFECGSCLDSLPTAGDHALPPSWKFRYGRDDKNEGLAEDQCDSAFPGLYEDVHRGIEYWSKHENITHNVLDDVSVDDGMTRAMIYDGELYIIAAKSTEEDHRRKMVATLSSIHRALTAFPARRSLPNIEFIFAVKDKADDVGGYGLPLWVFARTALEKSLWLMPDFGYWSWEMIIRGQDSEIGPYDEVVDKVLSTERDLDFSAKEPKLVWRGTLSFDPKLRRALVNRSRNEVWADVKELNWRVEQNHLTMEDHCKYQFIAHAEGRSYSASLKYRQACRSVVVIHKLQYIQHHHYLLVSHGSQQNYVEVERDFSDLPTKMDHLLSHPDEARKIADNSVKTFRERYLTPAAEACYWRALWRGYAQVSDRPQLWRTLVDGTRMKRGLRFETFIYLSRDEMQGFLMG